MMMGKNVSTGKPIEVPVSADGLSVPVSTIAETVPYSADIWVGTIGGAALGTDPSPNSTPPSAARIITLNPRHSMLLLPGLGSIELLFPPVAAASITLTPWYFDTFQNQWIQYGATLTITPTGAAGVSNKTSITAVMPGAKFFFQITANTNTQAFSMTFK